MGNSNPEIKTNKFLKFSVKLNKVCYCPGENIEGTLYLEGLPGLTETQLTNPKALFIISEKQKYEYRINRNKGNTKRIEELSRIIYQKYLIFNQFIDANLLSTVKIPFKINLPLTAYPSCSFFDGGYVKHNFSVEFELLKIKRTLRIVVKNNQNFTAKNQLLKIPYNFSGTKSKSKFLVNKGNFKIFYNSPKNSYSYDEPIPFEIKLDCRELNLKINQINITLLRQRKKNYSSNLKSPRITQKEELVYKSFKLSENKPEYNIKSSLTFPRTLNFDKYVNPPLVYQTIDKKGPFTENYTRFQDLFHIYPSCRGGLISIEYFIKIKLYFDTSLTFDESFYIPIDFYSKFEEKKIDNNIGQISDYNPEMVFSNQYDKPIENEIKSSDNITEGGNDNNNINNIEQQNVNMDIDISDSGYVAPPPMIDNNDNNMKTI